VEEAAAAEVPLEVAGWDSLTEQDVGAEKKGRVGMGQALAVLPL